MGKEKKVLDKGFVKIIDNMGDDNRVVQSARVSYGAGTTTYRRDRELLRYLMRHEHLSPFEQVAFVFHIKMPIFVARQIVRHRTGKVSEISGRYSLLKDEYYIPEAFRIQRQSKDSKQGSGEPLEEVQAYKVISEMEKVCYDAFQQYGNFIENDGLAREEARFVLPLNTYTEWYWQMDLRNLFNFLHLRLDSHAQFETQQYAKAIYELIKPIVPISCEAFEDYILNAKKFSAQEMEIIKRHLLHIEEENILSKLELSEFKNKLGL